MRHAKHRFSLNRNFSIRKALIVSMVKNMLIYQRIRTTVIKAKATRPVVEKLITMAKKGTLAHKRRAFEILGDHALVSLLFTDIGPRFKDRASGFTRIIKIGNRRGDNARMVVFELTQIKEPKKKVRQDKEKDKEVKPAGEPKTEVSKEKEKPAETEKPKTEKAAPAKPSQKPTFPKKPAKKFFGGIRSIFKKERDSL